MIKQQPDKEQDNLRMRIDIARPNREYYNQVLNMSQLSVIVNAVWM